MYIENSTYKEQLDFTIELLDVAISIKLYMEGGGEAGTEGGDKGEGGQMDEGDQNEYGHQRRKATNLRAKTNYYLEFVGWR